MKKLLFLLVMMFAFIPNVYANEIKKITVDVYIDKNANAEITETWEVRGTDGTEWYHPFRDLGQSKISDFTVSMDGKALSYKKWNINESLRQKKGYYGINYTSTDTELCFGKYDFNPHTFVLKYKVSNFVFNTDDAQVTYWTFFPKFQNVDFKDFAVNIKSYYEFPKTLDVWGYGYKGYAYVSDGTISMLNSEDSVFTNNYAVLLIKFPKGTFTTSYTTAFKTFNDVYSAAQEGTFKHNYDPIDDDNIDDNKNNYNEEEKLSVWDIIVGFIKRLGLFIIMVPGAIFGGIAAARNGYGYKDNKIIDKKNVPNFRDIPCNKDIYYANALLYLNNFEYKETNILGAIILKWVKENKIGFIKQDVGIFKKEQNCLDLRNKPVFENTYEEKLFNIMHEASGDGILEPKEFGKWAKRNYSKFFNIFKDFRQSEISKLNTQGHIYQRKDKTECKKKNVMDDVIYEDSKKLYGLKKFLQEFSSINTRETLEVHIWDEYLMFAYLFGIADKVAKQLKNLYPELMEQQQNMDYTTIMMINNFSTTAVQAATSARSAAESYHSGGGGFSVGGGGGGSFGGGGFSGGGSR